ncbi:putative phosphatidylinositol 4-kinase type 2-beta [Platanthera guangdongensis]|uniref:1-phosphatidylinositol 4-kinase n=1 Tax=Platanthera guangdongensis TaxID=2320717 RepID=A0ABR2LX77_9ASPA
MAVAVGNHLPGGMLKRPSGVIHRCRCRIRSFPHPDLPDFPSLSPPLFQRSRSTPCFPSSASDVNPRSRVEIVGSRNFPIVHALVVEAALAMAFGARLAPANRGLGGAYFLRGPAGNCLAVVKPVMEQPLSVFVLGRPASRLCVRAIDICIRESAAYLLDHANFAGVPPTALIRISHPALSVHPSSRVASIQRFIPHEFDAGDLGPSRFSVASVHRIGILDVRLLNTDRHAGNLLVQKQSMSKNYREEIVDLVPIDHGLCLPELLGDPYFEWLHWPQASVPFSDIETEYVSKLNPFKDAELLRSELPSLREPAIRILTLCTIFLKKAVGAGLCLADIGSMMTRDFSQLEKTASVLEDLCKKAEKTMAGDSHLYEIEGGCNCIPGEDERKKKGDITGAGEEDVVEVSLPLRIKRNNSLDMLQEKERDDGEEDNERGEREKELGTWFMKRSSSFSARDLSSNGRRIHGNKAMSFVRMNEGEWRLFLDKFEQLLPEVLEVRKHREMKQRRGFSCKF